VYITRIRNNLFRNLKRSLATTLLALLLALVSRGNERHAKVPMFEAPYLSRGSVHNFCVSVLLPYCANSYALCRWQPLLSSTDAKALDVGCNRANFGIDAAIRSTYLFSSFALWGPKDDF
jgi:hypothetical protein